mgnify:FL=1
MRSIDPTPAPVIQGRRPARSPGPFVAVVASALAIVLLVAAARAPADGDGEVAFQEEEAFQAAAAAVAPSVVRVEVAGVSEAGLGSAAEASPASGPSSGLVVGADGWVVATSFAVPKDIDQAVVTLADGSRRVAKVTGRDLSRGLVLLKVDVPAGSPELTVPEPAPRGGLRVGQWSLVLGRAWDAPGPSVGIGILSATNRAWGKAVQTDASVSPANYGGALLDIAGRVIGILAPLPAETAGMTAGTELYDSGIGFAVPLEDVLRVLPRLQAGETLAPGVMGIGYASRDPFSAPPVVATCRAGSPAAKAGLRPGDRIVEAAGLPVTRVAQLRHALAPRYAGDSLDLVVERGEARERVPLRVELVAALPPWRKPVLGIVPDRVAPAPAGAAGAKAPERDAARGVKVSWIWPGGPAAAAGIAAGDRILAVRRRSAAAEEEPRLDVNDAASLAGFVGGLEAGDDVELSVDRGGTPIVAAVTLGSQPALPPPEVPTRDGDAAAAAVEKLAAAEIAKPAWVVLPPGGGDEPVGVLVYCGPPGAGEAGAKGAELDAAARRAADRWKQAATRYGVAVVLPSSADPQRWGREDIRALARSLDGLRLRRPIDPTRVAFAGSGPGGAFAWLAAEALGPAVRGVALLDATLPRQASVEPTEPGRSRVVLFGASPGADVAREEADRRRLEAAGYPVGLLPELSGDPVPVETLGAWVEALGVL